MYKNVKYFFIKNKGIKKTSHSQNNIFFFMSELLRIFASAHTGNVLRRALALAETGSTRMM